MDLGFTQGEMEFRKEVEDFVKGMLPPDWDDRTVCWPGSYGTLPQMELEFQEITRDFNRKLGQKGWLSLGWPKEYGGKELGHESSHFVGRAFLLSGPSGRRGCAHLRAYHRPGWQ